MKKFVTVFAAFVLMAATQLVAQNPPSGSADRMNNPSLSAADRTFMNKACQGGIAEVEMGKLAKEHGSNQAVKDFGQRMIDDHTKAGDELKQVAQQKGITLPGEMTAQDKATYDRLSKLHGAAFDRAYMKDMVTDHRKDVSEFQRESTGARDNDVKSFAAKTLPTLQDHLKQAEDTNRKVAGEK